MRLGSCSARFRVSQPRSAASTAATPTLGEEPGGTTATGSGRDAFACVFDGTRLGAFPPPRHPGLSVSCAPRGASPHSLSHSLLSSSAKEEEGSTRGRGGTPFVAARCEVDAVPGARSTTPASRSCVASHTSFFGANDIAPRARDRASEATSAETPRLRPDVRLGCGAVWRGSSAVAGCHAAVRLGRDEVPLILYIYLGLVFICLIDTRSVVNGFFPYDSAASVTSSDARRRPRWGTPSSTTPATSTAGKAKPRGGRYAMVSYSGDL